MNKIAIIGDTESTLGFLAVGFSVFPATSGEQAAKTLVRLASEGYAIIYITEDLACEITDTISRYKDSPTPAVIMIPGKSGSRGIGMHNIKKSAERAIGADILFKE